MKKLMTLFFLVTTAVTFAQTHAPLRFGIKAGANLSHVGVSNGLRRADMKNSFGPGFFGGGLLEISGPAGSKFKGQVEALFSYHTFKNTYMLVGTSSEQKTNLSQISVPLMVRYFPIPSLSFNAGASVNFNLAGKTKIDTATVDHKDIDDLQTLQIGALAGATYYIYKGFFVDARYNYFFGSIFKKDKSDDPSYRLSAIQVGLGYKF